MRRFDETVLENFASGVFFGTTHTYLGQEANAAGILSHLQVGDIVFSNHRCHGHFLAYGGDPRALFAELMGRSTGVCSGRGGSQHLHWKNFYSNGVQGGITPIASGIALAEKRKSGDLPPDQRPVAIAFLGDGTLGEGVVYEALNLAALWQAPVLFVLENNHIAQTTPTHQAIAGNMAARFKAFGIPTYEIDSSDVLEILPVAGRLLSEVRQQQAPRALILHTCRFGPHSKGDDTRPQAEIDTLRQQRDPLAIHAPRLAPAERTAIEAQIDETIQRAYQQALQDPFPTFSRLNVYTFERLHVTESQRSSATVLESINAALHSALADDPAVLLLGEDLLDPYGGAFKVCRGLSSAFPGRVLSTPISEAGFTGLATGMALRGLRPVVEIMFGDFVALIADQVINHAAKFRWMYNEQVNVPLVIRAPMGGRRGYGPTHSQSLEKHFLGVPGLSVLAPTALGDPGALLYQAIRNTQDPVLFIENKLLYLQRLHTPQSLAEFEIRQSYPQAVPFAPTYHLLLQDAPPPTLTLAAYGYMAELAMQAALKLAYEFEVFCELVIPTQLAPFELDPIIDSAKRTQRLVTIEEGTMSLGWGAETLAQTAQALGAGLLAARRVAALDIPVPASGPLEAAMLPEVEQIIRVCQEVALKG